MELYHVEKCLLQCLEGRRMVFDLRQCQDPRTVYHLEVKLRYSCGQSHRLCCTVRWINMVTSGKKSLVQ